jgi:hypothetical protein
VLLAAAEVVLVSGVTACAPQPAAPPAAAADRMPEAGGCAAIAGGIPVFAVDCTDRLATTKVLAVAERVLATVDSASTTPTTECSATPGTRTVYPWTLLPAPDGSTTTPARARMLCLGPKDQAAGSSVDSAQTGDCLNEKADYAVVPCAAKEATTKVLRRIEKPTDAAQACAALPITSVFDATAAGGFALCVGRVR